MADALTPLDATFLELEQDDDAAHMHIGGALVFDSRSDRSCPTIDELRTHIDRRLEPLPRYRCRLSKPKVVGLTWPEWQRDDQFDVSSHVRHATLDAPGRDSELCDWLSDYWSHRLDRRRPLWEVVLLEGLEGDRWGLVTKTHHAMVDGVGSVDVGALMLDESESPEPVAAPPPQPDAAASSPGSRHPRRDRLTGVLRWGPEQALRAAHAGADVATHPAKALDMLERSRATVGLLVRDELIAAPHSSLNCPIGATRRFAIVRMPLADAKQIRAKLGGTVNDVVLASVTGGLRHLLDQRREQPPSQGLRAMVPMNVRQASERLGLGNRISSLFVHLPVAGSTPGDRYRLVVAEAEQLKAGDQALGTSSIVSLAGLAPPILHAVIARSLYSTRLFNVTVTNVPGPQMPLFALGCRLREIFPLVPLAADHAVGIAIFSYDGTLFYGINVAADAVPDLDLLVEGIASEIDCLRDLAAAEPARNA